MPRKSVYAGALPQPVEATLAKLSADLKVARLSRGITMADAAARLGIDRRGISNMESGAPQTPISTIAGAMWLYGLERNLADIAAPARDPIGLALDIARRPKTARTKQDDAF